METKQAISYKDGLIEERNYTYKDGYFSTLLKVYVPFGLGTELEVSDVIRLFDTVILEGVQIAYVTKHQRMTKKYYDKLIDKFRDTSIMENNLSSSKNEAENRKVDGSSDDIGSTIRVKKKEHRQQYQQTQAEQETAAVYRWDFKLKCESAELLDRQLQAIRDNFDGIADGDTANKKLKGINLVAYTGKQLHALNDLFINLIEEDRDNAVSTQENYAGLDFFISTSLKDDNSVVVGYDIFSRQLSKVMIDFVGSMSKNAVIAVPESQSVDFFTDKRTGKPTPTSSILAQAVANQFSLERRKVAHIVLNGYDYRRVKGAKYNNFEEAFEVVDMALTSINPLQLEGERERQAIIYQNIQNKLSLIMNILLDFSLDTGSYTAIKGAVSDVLSRGFWSDNATLYPLKAKLVGQMRETYPLVSNVITALKRDMSSQSVSNTDMKIDRLNTLINILEQALNDNKNLIGRATTLSQIDKEQTYYDFRNVGADKYKMVQFVNLLNNLSQMLSRGDLLVIHGTQILDSRVFDEYIKAELEEVYQKGVRVLFSFDNTSEPYHSSIFTLGGKLYHTFPVDIDWSFIGYVPQTDFKMVENLFNEPMNESMRVNLTTPSLQGRGIFYRFKTKTLHFVDLMPKI